MTRKTDAEYSADRLAIHFEAGFAAGKFASAGTTSQPFVGEIVQARTRVVEAAKAEAAKARGWMYYSGPISQELFDAVAELERLEAEAKS